MRVSFETSIAAAKKGYTEGSTGYYDKDGNYFDNFTVSGEAYFFNGLDPELSEAPLQWELQKWLRDRHTPIVITPQTDFVAWYVYIDNPDLDRVFIDENLQGRLINSYEEALELGLQEALKMI